MTRWLPATVIVALSFAIARPVVAQNTKRYALVVGHNEGLVSEIPLRHAEQDALRMRDVLTELGSFDRVDVLKSPSASDLSEALERLPGELEVLVFYYSGHAGGGALHIGGEEFAGLGLLEALDRALPKLRIAVVDACESGDLGSRTKGLTVTAAPLEEIREHQAAGKVLLASASPGEAAQESDRLGGSFFTAHLVAGLRGAADVDEDGRVTLREVYRHARDRTMNDTFLSAAGMQRPSFRLRLDGEGDVPLTWPAVAGGRVELGGDAPGRYFVTAAPGGQLMAEVVLGADEKRSLAFPQGQYQVKKREAGGALIAELRLESGQQLSLRDQDMERVPLVRLAEKGGLLGAYVVGFRLGTGLAGADFLGGVDLGYAVDLKRWSIWPSVRFGGGRSRNEIDTDVIAGDLGVAFTANFRAPRWRGYVGLRPAVLIVHQRLSGVSPATSTAGQGEVLLGIDAWLGDRLGVFGVLGANLSVLQEVSDPRRAESEWNIRPGLSLELGARWR